MPDASGERKGNTSARVAAIFKAVPAAAFQRLYWSAMAEKMKMTRKGYDQLKKTIEHLKTTRREQISEDMGVAIADGDLRESAAYDQARLDQSENESRILELEDQLENADVIEEGSQDGVGDRKSTRLNSSHVSQSRMPSSA